MRIVRISDLSEKEKKKWEEELEQRKAAYRETIEARNSKTEEKTANISIPYSTVTQNNKQQTLTNKLKAIAPINNEPIKSTSKIGETQKATLSDVKAQEKAKK